MTEFSTSPGNPSGAVIPLPARPQPQRIHLDELGSIYLRGKTWWIEYWHQGKQHRESSHSPREKDARKLLKKRCDELANHTFVAPKHDRLQVRDFLESVRRDYDLGGHRSQRTLKFRLAHLLAAFGNLRAGDVTTSMVEAYKAKRLEEGKARATCNRELATLRRAYTLAVKQKLIAPGKVPTIALLREDNARQGFVTFEEFTALVTHLPTPVDDVTHFAYRSGWRRGEVLTLTWDDVDQDNGVIRLRPELSKNRKGRTLPITPAVGEILARRWHARLVMTPDGPRVCDLVFHRDGQPVRDFKAAWRKAAKAIGRPELLFHDLRRSAVRNFEQAGVPRSVAMELTGHLTESVYRRYAIVSQADKRAALERTEASLTADPHKTGIFPHNNFSKYVAAETDREP
jgi:integrase